MNDAVWIDARCLMQLIRWVLLPSVTSALVVLGLVRACRWIASVSPRLGLLVAAGLGVRVAAALGLFWISFLHLPILSSLQNGPGFWRMALDSQWYHRLAVYGAEQGISTIPAAASSRTYIAALGLWMALTGTSVFSGVVLNLCCYVGTCALVIAVLRGLPTRRFERTAMVSVVGLSASPMLLFVSTQVLKDSFFLFFAVLLNVGVWLLTAPMAQLSSPAWKRMPLGVPAFAIAMFVTSGVRGYYPAIAIVACGFLLVSLILRRRRHYWVVALAAAISIAAGAGALRFGSEVGSAYFRQLTSIRTPADVMKALSVARGAFIVAGGATNVGDSGTETSGGISATRDKDSVEGFAEAMAIGVATMFVPLTLLQALSIVHVSGGGAMRLLGDIDTVCFDIMLIATAVMAWRLRREVRGNTPYLIFSISLALMLTILMAYIVTNVGTLVRLRLMLAVPFWTLTFAFARLPRFVGGDAIDQPNDACDRRGPTTAGPIGK